MDAVQEALFNALVVIAVGLIGWLARKVAKYLDELGLTEKLDKKQYLVDLAVNAVEQIWKNEDGATKLVKARNQALDLLNDNGIDITASELNNMVEASVKAMNDAFNSTKVGVIELTEEEK